VVILADADWPQKNTKRNFWVDIDKPWLEHFKVGILPVVKEVTQTEFAYLYDEEEASSFLDMLNLLYVGTTRAEDILYILSTEVKRMPERNNSITVLLINFLKTIGRWDDGNVYEFGDVNTVKLKNTGSDSEKDAYKSERVGHVSKEGKQVTIKRNSQLLWNEELVGEIDRANLIQDILKRIIYVAGLEKVLTQMLHEGTISSHEREQLQKDITTLLGTAAVAKYFKQPYKVMNERAILNYTNTYMPARVVIYKDECVVIDYNTGVKRGEDVERLKECITEMGHFGVKDVKGFLLYTSTGIVEQVT
jgi:hypothetical protein